jgi:hypothetical protein
MAIRIARVAPKYANAIIEPTDFLVETLFVAKSTASALGSTLYPLLRSQGTDGASAGKEGKVPLPQRRQSFWHSES